MDLQLDASRDVRPVLEVNRAPTCVAIRICRIIETTMHKIVREFLVAVLASSDVLFAGHLQVTIMCQKNKKAALAFSECGL